MSLVGEGDPCHVIMVYQMFAISQLYGYNWWVYSGAYVPVLFVSTRSP